MKHHPAHLLAAQRIALSLVRMRLKPSSPEFSKRVTLDLHTRQAAYRFCDRIGLKYDPNRNPRAAHNVAWNGKVLKVEGTLPQDILHHAAHYVLAPPSRRKLVEFGLGPGFDTGNDKRALAARKINPKRGQKEEYLASILGILIEKALRMGNPRQTLLDHQWELDGSVESIRTRPDRNTLVCTIARLIRRGLIDYEGRLLFLEDFR